MNGQERIEAAFSPEGTPEIPAVICYEGIFVRDHWSQLSSDPWWIRHSFDIERQSAWRRQVVEAISQDWFALPLGPSYDERAHLSIRAHEGAAYMVDDRTGERRGRRAAAVPSSAVAGGGERSVPSQCGSQQ